MRLGELSADGLRAAVAGREAIAGKSPAHARMPLTSRLSALVRPAEAGRVVTTAELKQDRLAVKLAAAWLASSRRLIGRGQKP
jgi:hypothetical protein